MIMSAIKTTCLFFGFILFLSITVKEKPIFMYVYGVISPATTFIQDTTETAIQKSLAGTQKITKKLFDNSVPKMDSVKTRLSGNKKTTYGEPDEKISNEDKSELDQLIKNY